MKSRWRWGVIVLAAGQGTRMRSALPKVLHPAGGRTLLDRVLDRAGELAATELVVVVIGHGADQVRHVVALRSARTRIQSPQLGTGDALRVGLGGFEPGEIDAVVVLSGDVPLLTRDSIVGLCRAVEDGAAAAVLTADLDQPAAYGRIVRGPSGQVEAIVEARDASPEIRALTEVNAGVYAFRHDPVRDALSALQPDNTQGEYYLTDVIAALRGRSLGVAIHRLDDPREMLGVNTRADLARVGAVLNQRRLDELMDSGVTVVDPRTTWVEDGCVVGRDVELGPGVVLRAGCRIGDAAVIGAHCVLDGAEVAPGERVPALSHRAAAGDRGR